MTTKIWNGSGDVGTADGRAGTVSFPNSLNYFCCPKRTLSPVRLVLEDSSKRSFMLFVVVSLQLGSII